MVAFFVTAPEIGIMLVIMVKESSLRAQGTARILTRGPRSRIIRCKLMVAITAEIFLKAENIFTVTIELMIIVALWTTD
jgi:hypothetical protein